MCARQLVHISIPVESGCTLGRVRNTSAVRGLCLSKTQSQIMCWRRASQPPSQLQPGGPSAKSCERRRASQLPSQLQPGGRQRRIVWEEASQPAPFSAPAGRASAPYRVRGGEPASSLISSSREGVSAASCERRRASQLPSQLQPGGRQRRIV